MNYTWLTNAEKKACDLLNSKKIKHKWKKDFKLDNSTEDWDLINGDKIKIEVKSTINEKRFNFNSISPNMPNQKKQTILKLLHYKNGKIKQYKFVKFRKNKWNDITNEIIQLENESQYFKK